MLSFKSLDEISVAPLTQFQQAAFEASYKAIEWPSSWSSPCPADRQLCVTAPLIEMPAWAQREPSHQPEPSQTKPLAKAGPMNRLAEDLALELGCPVEVTYLQSTREVVAVAHPGPDREVRATASVRPFALCHFLIGDPYGQLEYELLKELRYRMGQWPADG